MQYLTDQMPKKLITSALVYANGPLHIGHLVEYIQTDIFVRFLKLKGEDVIYCCADDTHGAPIQINADKLGMKPEQMIAKFLKEHKRDFKAFKVDFDNYYTTHSDENKHYSDLLFKRAKKNGFITKKRISQLFCPNDKMFLPDRYVKGTCPKCKATEQYGDVCEKCGATYKPTELTDPHCSICNTTPVEKESEHYFFKLSKFSAKLEKWLKSADLQKEIVNSVKQWIKEGLQDWDITRDGPYFGFKIPGEANLYYYVWWDAPIGYIAASENYTQKHKLGDAEKNYWKNKNAEIIHFIGKDIIYFHFLFWPAVLMAAGLEKPKKISVHGFLTVNGEKMSKSRGTFFTAEDFLKEYEAEHLRYYYASSLGKKLSDVDLSMDDFIAKTNNELVANIGNFCYRTISFTNANFDSKITEPDEKVLKEIDKKIKTVEKHYSDINLMEACRSIMEISAYANKFMQDSAPWKIIKEDKAAAQKTMSTCVNIAKILAILIKPIMPEFANNLEIQLKINNPSWKDLDKKLTNHKIGKAKLLVNKIEKTEKKILPFNLRVSKILEAETHPDADKLIIMQIDTGIDKRQIVAGLKGYYEPEELVGKSIIVVTNLKPAKLRGETSQGMLLAAQYDKKVIVIEPKGIAGDSVLPEGYEANLEEISFDRFMKINKMTIKNKKLVFSTDDMLIKGKTIKVEMPDKSIVR